MMLRRKNISLVVSHKTKNLQDFLKALFGNSSTYESGQLYVLQRIFLSRVRKNCTFLWRVDRLMKREYQVFDLKVSFFKSQLTGKKDTLLSQLITTARSERRSITTKAGVSSWQRRIKGFGKFGEGQFLWRKTPLTPHFRIFSKEGPSGASFSHPLTRLECSVFSLGSKSDQCYHHSVSWDVQCFCAKQIYTRKEYLGGNK
jgi:hypothetical protein